jgi:hypothetical protein
METKVCCKCRQEKNLSCFAKCKKAKDGHKHACKNCLNAEKRIYNKEHPEVAHHYYEANKNVFHQKNQKWAEENRERSNAIKKKYILNNPDKRKEQANRYNSNNKDKRKLYVLNNKDLINGRMRIYKKTNPQARIAHNLRTRVCAILNGRSKGGRLHLLVGCTMDFLKDYIEMRFQDNMNWANYGRGLGKWSIDHIVPLETFDLTDIEQQKIAFHYSNMQPMWYDKNSSKGSLHNGVRYTKKMKQSQIK